MSEAAELLFSSLGERTLNSFRDDCKAPVAVQKDVLSAILRQNTHTAYGKKFGFAGISNYTSFQRAVPLASYSSLEPYFEATFNGDDAQLTAELPIFFAQHFAHNSTVKHLPITQSSLEKLDEYQRIYWAALRKEHASIFSGKLLSIVSPKRQSFAPLGTPCGALSGCTYQQAPPAIQSSYAVPAEAFEVPDYESRIYTLLRLSVGSSVTLLTANDPNALLLLAHRLSVHAEYLLKDLRDGTLSRHVDVPIMVRHALANHLRPDPIRARLLERAVKDHQGQLLPSDIWPNLSIVTCRIDGSHELLIPHLKAAYGSGTTIRNSGFQLATVQGSIPIVDMDTSGVLAVASSFLEFYPADDNRSPGPLDLLTLEQLEEGRSYVVYVTTTNGLYRYATNQIVEVVGYYFSTPIVRYLRQTHATLSFAGEELTETQVLAAVRRAFKFYPHTFLFVASIGEPRGETPHYAFLIEFERLPDEDEGFVLIRSLDAALMADNPVYRQKRESRAIDPPVLRAIAPGGFERYFVHEAQRGAVEANPPQKLTADKSFRDRFEVEHSYFLPDLLRR